MSWQAQKPYVSCLPYVAPHYVQALLQMGRVSLSTAYTPSHPIVILARQQSVHNCLHPLRRSGTAACIALGWPAQTLYVSCLPFALWLFSNLHGDFSEWSASFPNGNRLGLASRNNQTIYFHKVRCGVKQLQDFILICMR